MTLDIGFQFRNLGTKKQWEQGRIFPFYKNVMCEGVEIK